MLQISHLYANYGGKPALEDINLTLESGELLVVLGPVWLRQNHLAESDCRFCALSARQHSTGG